MCQDNPNVGSGLIGVDGVKILILSFYYPPDLSAGSFRTSALVSALLEELPSDARIEVLTTLPNRYSSFTDEAPGVEEAERVTIRRIKLPAHQSGMLDQAKAFMSYARGVATLTRHSDYDLVFGTSSRLMTAALSAYVARRQNTPLYLDIRDIFVDTIKDVLPGKIAFVLKPFFSLIESWAINRAGKVNLVSRGFEGYFTERYSNQRFEFFTNGIDTEFVEAGHGVPKSETPESEQITVLYAGNMGEGQGLHAIVPELAKRMEDSVKFRLIGDGGRRPQLEAKLEELNYSNVEILPPVKRDRLIEEYQNADVLFLHLNDYPAFEKVLPSKLFEYAAMGKPVWAGVAGYAAEFVKSEIVNSAVFYPCDVKAAEQSFSELKLRNVDRSDFIEKFDRRNIARKMARDVVSIVVSRKS